MKIHSQVLGQLEYQPQDIIHFPDGIPAFETQKQFLLIPVGEDTPYLYLQAVKNTNLCLILTNPFVFFSAYEIDIPDEIIAKLDYKTTQKDNLLIYTVLTIPEDFTKTTANLMAPIIINPKNKKGLQFIPQKTDYNTKHFLFPTEQAATPREEDSHASLK